MKELKLKYGCNQNQKQARVFMNEGELPIKILNGNPGYINLLDAFNSWQLVKELKEATGLAAAASFKHVSPAGAAVAIPSTETLKYTQSNSVCYVKDGQAIGIGAGQQSRIHCTRLAGKKADAWFLRQNPKVMNLPFKQEMKRADRDNAIDVYISDDNMDILSKGQWENIFTEKPDVLTKEEREQWLGKLTGVTLGSDAFFPFGDNIERAKKSGGSYIAQAGGSIRDDNIVEICDKYNMAMAFTGIRLFHH